MMSLIDIVRKEEEPDYIDSRLSRCKYLKYEEEQHDQNWSNINSGPDMCGIGK
jgi:hypothetical protein